MKERNRNDGSEVINKYLELEEALENDNIDLVKIFSSKKSNILDLIRNNSFDMMDWLINNSLDLEMDLAGKEDYRKPLLMAAMENESEDMAILLINSGSEIEYNDKFEEMDSEVIDEELQQPLGAAAANGWINVVKLLVERGCDINSFSGYAYGYMNALMFAAAEGHTEIVAYLLSKGADIKAVYEHAENDSTAIDIARDEEHTNIVNLLTLASSIDDLYLEKKDINMLSNHPIIQQIGQLQSLREDLKHALCERIANLAIRSNKGTNDELQNNIHTKYDNLASNISLIKEITKKDISFLEKPEDNAENKMGVIYLLCTDPATHNKQNENFEVNTTGVSSLDSNMNDIEY